MNSENTLMTSLFSRLEDYVDLYITELGKEKCSPNKSIIHVPRDYYRIHYVLEGQGSYVVKDKVYNLKKGDLFLTLPMSDATWHPSKTNPWTYAWVGFNGIKAKKYLELSNLNVDNLIVSYHKDDYFIHHFLEMVDSLNRSGFIDIKCIGHLYMIFSKLVELGHRQNRAHKLNTRQSKVREAILFIKSNYPVNITIKDIADSLYLNPNYLSNIFKNIMGESLIQYLTRVRIEKACELLVENKDLKVKEIAQLVGYEDPLYFSKVFKKSIKVSPIVFRNSSREID